MIHVLSRASKEQIIKTFSPKWISKATRKEQSLNHDNLCCFIYSEKCQFKAFSSELSRLQLPPPGEVEAHKLFPSHPSLIIDLSGKLGEFPDASCSNFSRRGNFTQNSQNCFWHTFLLLSENLFLSDSILLKIGFCLFFPRRRAQLWVHFADRSAHKSSAEINRIEARLWRLWHKNWKIANVSNSIYLPLTGIRAEMIIFATSLKSFCAEH